MSGIVDRAVRMGLVDASDAEKVLPDKALVIGLLINLVESEGFRQDCVEEDEILQMESEISKLNDFLDLEECDRVEPAKSFSREGVRIHIPPSLVPFVRQAILPMLEQAIKKDP
jgi:hypothetical protein